MVVIHSSLEAFSSEKNTYSNVATISLTINSVNDAPVVVVQDSLNEFSILFDNKPVFGFDTSDVDDDLSEVNVRVLVNGVEYPTTLYDVTIPENPYPFGVEVDITNLKKAGLTTFEILVNDGETDGIGIIRTYVAREVVVVTVFDLMFLNPQMMLLSEQRVTQLEERIIFLLGTQ